MKSTVVFSILIILFSITTAVFIYKTNDHKDCNADTKIVYGKGGKKIVYEIHSCKERFNL